MERRAQAVEAMRPFLADSVASGVPPRAVVRHMLGLFNGLPGARQWRRTLSDASILAELGEAVLDRALEGLSAATSAH